VPPGERVPQSKLVQLIVQLGSLYTPTFTALIVPEDCTDCVEVRTPAVSIVKKSPVIAIAIVTPNDTLRIPIALNP